MSTGGEIFKKSPPTISYTRVQGGGLIIQVPLFYALFTEIQNLYPLSRNGSAKSGCFRKYIGISPIFKNVVFCKSKNCPKEFLETSTRPQNLKFGQVASFMVFSKRYLGFLEIFIFCPFLAVRSPKFTNLARFWTLDFGFQMFTPFLRNSKIFIHRDSMASQSWYGFANIQEIPYYKKTPKF